MISIISFFFFKSKEFFNFFSFNYFFFFFNLIYFLVKIIFLSIFNFLLKGFFFTSLLKYNYTELMFRSFLLVFYTFWFNLSNSFLPFFFSLLTLFFFSNLLIFFKFNFFFFIIIILFSFFFFKWFLLVFIEALLGIHSFFSIDGFKFGFLLFLFSEIMFFFSFFWFFFDLVLVTNVDLGFFSTPLGLEKINPFGLPFLNSLLLLGSASVITFSHYTFLFNGFSLGSILFSIFLGFFFILIQLSEYLNSFFGLSDSVFGSLFFLATGFHGLHVMLGIIFIFINFFRHKNKTMNFFHHIGFEFSIIYWHFVDVVWLFLFFFIYWWVF